MVTEASVLVISVMPPPAPVVAFLRKGAKLTSALDPAATAVSVMYSPTTPPPGAMIRMQGRNDAAAADPSNAANRLFSTISWEPGTV
jgi:hypothetical protein